MRVSFPWPPAILSGHELVCFLKECLEYNPETGMLTWRVRPEHHFKKRCRWKAWNSQYPGENALSTINSNGYLMGTIGAKKFKTHRVVFAIYHGRWPSKDIDHINGNRTDNRIENLREVTRLDNLRNGSLPRHNSSGRVGVAWRPEKRKWRAFIQINGRQKHLGYFDDRQAAIMARQSAERQFGFRKNGRRGE